MVDADDRVHRRSRPHTQRLSDVKQVGEGTVILIEGAAGVGKAELARLTLAAVERTDMVEL
jgi:serine kinase of HPr protein (carbohydrate metabolism regulator)